MRTTVELTEDQRAELLKLAAKRGLKGFSQLVQEALNEYLKRQSGRHDLIEAALQLKGTLTGTEADDFEQSVQSIRRQWR
jgi:metal-responsive CopG/Arc/MetJ family transcriptional regulator